MSITSLRDLFPFFSSEQNQSLIYFDSAATSLKLDSVIQAQNQYYQFNTANVHRSSYKAATQVTAQFEQTRCDVQTFIKANSPAEIIWTKGATDSLNLIANCLTRSDLLDNKGSEILIAASEHHSNIVPWQALCNTLGFQIKVMPVDKNGVLKLEESLQLISENTAVICIAQVSNALGNINPIKPLIERAKANKALTVIDGTQAVAHMPINVAELDCDFYVFSGHKMYGPTGIGVLYAKLGILEQLPPYQLGGEMVKTVSFSQGTSFQPSPLKFEAGTPNIGGVLGLAEAVKFIQNDINQIETVEEQLYKRLIQILTGIPQVKLWGDTDNTICLQSFTLEGVNVYDLAVMLDEHNIAVRVGHHCAMPLINALGIEGVLRVSLSCYNTVQELDFFEKALKQSISILLDPGLDSDSSPTPEVLIESEQTTSVNNNLTLGLIAKSLKAAKGWDNTYRQLMLAGKGLQRLADLDKTPDTEVFGCESQVWVKCELSDNKVLLVGDSPSKIVRGLLAVIFEVLNHQQSCVILSFDLTEYLASLGLSRHLSESRGNGLAAVFDKIRKFCLVNGS
ncbi:aminotransferase class V-fold PLP-dependent enzyme [Paraglaciecola aquimarina]|uniref:cysteine desulfurase n=1 Tax=Paraglaciecola algarum TaxID=3050085 RepID=A0ABS9D7P1_9ALTE|nr:aminotransferase class V-fold PLP-dependent enzyme [Paraglaciecola sp. G1-23]MCF2948973.1 aminotransferase class V-fold PLP-dependent enzyme [Paraglaciecola sp. G1-23]